MLAQRTYWIQNKTSRALESMDDEEHAALVAIMRNMAKFCGINVLTYNIESGNLGMLVSCPAREHHLAFFENAENESPGSGEQRLLEHLRNQYNDAHVREIEKELNSLREQGEDVRPMLKHYTRRIGSTKKFAEGINEAFIRWIKKNRPQLFDKFEGNICRKGITQTYVELLQKQREIAKRMDRDAVWNDDGGEPRKYWCGYADALRGDEDAMDGLREIMKSPADTALDIKELGYCSRRKATKSGRPNPHTQHSRTKQRPATNPATRPVRHKIESTGFNEMATISSSDRTPTELPPMGRGTKRIMLTLLGLILIGVAAGVVFVIIEWRQYKTDVAGKTEVGTMTPPDENKTNELTVQQRQLASATDLLYEPEARQLAEDFAKCGDPELRLKMSRDQTTTRQHMTSYAAEALDKKASEVVFMDVVDLGGIMAARFIARFEDSTSRLLCVVPTPDGLRVDWDCYARYNAQAWQDLLDGKINSAELRTFTMRSDYYNFDYRDDTKWISFILKSPDHDGVLYAYIARGTTAAKLLEAALPSDAVGKNVQLTIKVSATNDGQKRRQFTIDRVYAFGWVRPEVDIEDAYRSKVHNLVTP